MRFSLRREYGRFLTSGAQVLLIVLGFQIDTPTGWVACAGLIALVSLFAWMSTWRRARAILDTPTSKIASAAQGYTELVGAGQPLSGVPLISPLRHVTCLWFRYTVERHRENKWETESSGESDASFLVDDGSGQCLVDVAGAEIQPAQKETWTQFDYRYTEWTMIPGEKVYALGQFETKSDAGLGITVHTLRRPEDGRLYLISTLPQEKLARRYRWWSLAHLAMFFGGLAGAAAALKMAA